MGFAQNTLALSVAILALSASSGRAEETADDPTCRPLVESNAKLASTERFQAVLDKKLHGGRVVHRELVVIGANAYQRNGPGEKYIERSFASEREGLGKNTTHAACAVARSEIILGRNYDVWDYRFSELDKKRNTRQELACHTWLDHDTRLPLKRHCAASNPDGDIATVSLFWTCHQDLEVPAAEAISPSGAGN